MNLEIERKFLFFGELSSLNVTNGTKIRQGYIFDNDIGVCRVRSTNNKHFITIKSKSSNMLIRTEVETEITKDQANDLFKMCSKVLHKTRYKLNLEHVFEVDVFEDSLSGLTLIEVELNSENDEIIRREWLGPEVTYDEKFLNSNLINEKFLELDLYIKTKYLEH